MSGASAAATAESIALGVLQWLISSQGAAFVANVVGIVLGDVPGVLESDVDALVSALVQTLVPALGADRLRSEVNGMFDAADVAADVAERAKFPAGKP